MQYKNLGRTGLKVSRLALGTMNFGPNTSEEDSYQIMDKALELGINFFDTANVYGPKIGDGVTEQIIGRWLDQGGRRDQIVLATKVYGNMGSGPNEQHLSAYHIRKACEDSLRRLRTDHIDLYQFHHIDRATPWEEIWQAAERLVQDGKVIYFGSSNFAGWNLVQAQAAAASRHFLGLVSEQSLYNLAERTVELEVIPACRHLGIGLIPWSPLACGALAGKPGPGSTGRRHSEFTETFFRKHGDRIERFEAFAKEIGERPSDIALAWLLQNPVVAAPIIGPRTLEQLTDSTRALDITLTDEWNAKLDEIFPGPGGEAPEAYAW